MTNATVVEKDILIILTVKVLHIIFKFLSEFFQIILLVQNLALSVNCELFILHTANFCCFSSFPDCECDVSGSEGESCDDSGACVCKTNVEGPKCKECIQDYYGFPECEGI